MKVLLIVPPFNFEKFGRFKEFAKPFACSGLAYIAAVLEKNNIEVNVIDAFALRLNESEVLDIIKDKKPDVVGISCLTPTAPIVFSLAKNIKRYSNKITIVLGNIHASFFAENILINESVDVIVHGEGEYTMAELVQAIEEHKDFSGVKGISFRSNGKIIKTKPRELLKNLDDLPFPAWHLFPFKKYSLLSLGNVAKSHGLSIFGSRGCIYRCTFCCLQDTQGRYYRRREPRKIVDEIEYLMNNFSVRQVGFMDPIFPFSKQDGFEFCNEMVKRGLNTKIAWICETRPDMIDRELLKAMKHAGCKRIAYGLESGAQILLDNVKKGSKLSRIRDVIKYTKKENIQTLGFFMLGLPGETEETVRKTINFAKELDLDFAKFSITIPFPGSQLYEDLVSSMNFKRQDWENFVPYNPVPENLVYVPGNIEPEQLIKLQRLAHIEFYLRLRIIFRHLFKVRTVSIKDLFLGFMSLTLPWVQYKKHKR